MGIVNSEVDIPRYFTNAKCAILLNTRKITCDCEMCLEGAQFRSDAFRTVPYARPQDLPLTQSA